ncbi:MAG TPA: hypothetical protein VFV50_07590 [Bdellovibrionales bacterium]|nr:hypothetical protein [Bdellovibrionales bacterium]
MKTNFTLTLLAAALLAAQPALAATTKVGNGDDGADLEGFTELTAGPIADSRKAAVEHLKRLNVQGVSGLGTLIPEVEKAQLFMAKRDVEASLTEDQGSFHTNFTGLVFARTLPEPHAPTRFFPAASKLSEDQLIALHIHEGLHRALPASVREDENKVAQITLAITSPGATHDRVKTAAAKHIPEGRSNYLRAAGGSSGYAVEADAEAASFRSASVASDIYPIPDNAKVKRPSVFGYTYQRFNQSAESEANPVESMHSVQSLLYPFGTERVPIGIGIEASVLRFKEESQLGPLGLSFRMRLWSVRGFDIGTWASLSLNTLSAEELKNSPYGRDVFSTGISIRRDLKNFYVENIIGVTTPGTSTQKLGTVTYTHHYGSVVNANVKAGARLGDFTVGGYGEILLADNYRLSGPNFEDDTGRYQIVGAGPDIGFEQGNLGFRVFGRYVVSSTKGADFTTLGNIMGKGTGQGSVGAQLSVLF